MLKLHLLSSAVLFFFISLQAQTHLDTIMFSQGWKFYNGVKVIYVKGRLSGSYGKELTSIFDKWETKQKLEIKFEDELDSSDLRQHLCFFGPVKSFINLEKFLPPCLFVTANGFTFGPYNFTDSLDAVNLITSGADRKFQLGNSMAGLFSLWTTFQDMSNYLIMQGYAVTHHGFLKNDRFYPATHFNVDSLRKHNLKKYETKYYTFYFDPAAFTVRQNRDSLFDNEDNKLREVIKRLNFPEPERKIECCIYKTLQQKYYCSCTPGTGNPFSKAWQIHTVGLQPAEHEAIHILSNARSTFFSEGLVGYYYSIKDTMEWKKNKSIVSLYPPESVINLMYSGSFDFSPYAYGASAVFSKYLIDTYGIYNFRKAASYDDIKEALLLTYKKSPAEIEKEWQEYFNKNKIVPGPEREITFKVKTSTLPDTSSLCIAGDKEQLGRWNPGAVKLTRQFDGSWLGKFHFAQSEIISYKITRGTWDSEALDVNGNVPGNSILEVTGDETVEITVGKWKDAELGLKK